MSELIGIVDVEEPPAQPTGVHVFREQIVPRLIADSSIDTVKIEESGPPDIPLGRTIHQLGDSADFADKAEELGVDKLFLFCQDRLRYDPDRYSFQSIPYVHDIFPATTSYGEDASLARDVFQAMSRRWVYNIAKLDHIITPRYWVGQQVQARTSFNGSVYCVSQGVDHLPEPPDGIAESERDIDVLYIGTLQPRKNPRTVRENFRKWTRKGYTTTAVVPEGTDITATSVHHNVGRNQLAGIYASSSLIFRPSYLEGWGRPTFEAFRYGTVPLVDDLDKGLERGSMPVIPEINPGKKIDTTRRRNAIDLSESYNWEDKASNLADILRNVDRGD